MASPRTPLLRLLSAGSLLLALACQAPEPASPPKAAESFVPTLRLRPVTVSLGAGATQLFQAEINAQTGARYADIRVGWRVVESGGGTITPAGLYTAPATPGVYHVQVRREDHLEVTAFATVTVK
jgi:chitinase